MTGSAPGEVWVRRTCRRRRRRCRCGERDGCHGGVFERRRSCATCLDLAAVEDLVAEPEEDVLDLAADLRDQVQVAARELLAGQRDVDDLSSASDRSSSRAARASRARARRPPPRAPPSSGSARPAPRPMSSFALRSASVSAAAAAQVRDPSLFELRPRLQRLRSRRVPPAQIVAAQPTTARI